MMAIRNFFLCLAMVAIADVAMAHGSYQRLPTVAASDAAPAPDDDAVDLESLKQLGCPSGLESILPGIYYYCVGARDLAIDHYARGLSMLEIAAAWGSKPAQYTLGVGYFNGDVGPESSARPGLAGLVG